jgi:hypothetical protein
MHLRSRSLIGLLAGLLAVTIAAPAGAESSSVDAYGGQAAVLGKPVHRHPHRANPSAAGAGQENATGTAGLTGSGGSSGPGAGAGSRAGSPASAGSKRGAGAAGGAAAASAGIQAADASGGSLSLSALDWLALLAILAGAIATGITIRRLGRTPA